MTPYQQEQIEILRRIAERGKEFSYRQAERLGDPEWSDALDLFIHMLDEIKRLKNSAA